MTYRQLIETDWRVPLSPFDAIQSFLVEHPDHYYLAPNRQWLCYLTRDHGLLMFNHDYTGMSEQEISAFLIEALEALFS